MSKRISVVIASYNGAKYIEEQLNTILNQLSDDDEIIISDDGSVDGTIEKIKNINDARIKLIEGPHKGVKANFNNGLKECEGKYIFLCDQDDIWTGNKVDICLKYLKDHDLVVHDAVVVNSDDSEVIEDSFYNTKHSGKGTVKNIIRNTYIGCCMCFTRNLLDYILPVPQNIEMHDQWIGILNDLNNKNTIFIEEKLIRYRRHEATVTKIGKRYPIMKMVRNRINLVLALARKGKK